MKIIFKIKFILLLILLVQIAEFAFSQADAQYSQYITNPFFLNPAYSGNKDAVSAILMHRSQWIGVVGAPMTETLSIHTPLKSRSMGVGLQVINDNIGARNATGILASYSYKVRFGPGKLSLGLRGGAYAFQLNRNKVEYDTENDPYSIENINNKVVVSFDFGIYYSTKKFYTGATVTHLNKSEIKAGGSMYSPMKRHLYVIGGCALPLSEDFILRPSILLRYNKNAPVNTDFNAIVYFRELGSIGVSYRTSRDLIAMINYKINKNFSVGYAFDFVFGQIGNGNKANSHEICITYDLDVVNEKTLSPRYL